MEMAKSQSKEELYLNILKEVSVVGYITKMQF